MGISIFHLVGPGIEFTLSGLLASTLMTEPHQSFHNFNIYLILNLCCCYSETTIFSGISQWSEYHMLITPCYGQWFQILYTLYCSFLCDLFLGSLLNIEFCSHITFVYILPTIYKHL